VTYFAPAVRPARQPQTCFVDRGSQSDKLPGMSERKQIGQAAQLDPRGRFFVRAKWANP
jgi:hypothetical protein